MISSLFKDVLILVALKVVLIAIFKFVLGDFLLGFL